MSAEARALRRLRNGMGAFGLTWESALPDEVLEKSMDYRWTLLGEQVRDLGRSLREAFESRGRGS